ncbi:MAG: hypothetical protein EON58_20500 [Alphaproteobacteria bacterium]|nr:MAG: hypothetical protein EON58_20500 [Alphaproteobacteria bacterium]
MASLGSQLEGKDAADRLYRSEEGCRIANEEVGKMMGAIRHDVEQAQQAAPRLCLSLAPEKPREIHFTGLHGLRFSAYFANPLINHLGSAHLLCRINKPNYPQSDDYEPVYSKRFLPTFNSAQALIWTDEETEAQYTAEGVKDLFMEAVIESLREMCEGPFNRG